MNKKSTGLDFVLFQSFWKLKLQVTNRQFNFSFVKDDTGNKIKSRDLKSSTYDT